MVARCSLGIACGLVLLLGLLPAQPSAQDSATVGLVKNFRWRSIGPVNLGGRIDDIEAVESNPYIIYVGAATGGVWKTINNGTTWAPVFDKAPNLSIGDIAIASSDPNVVWVGTGEANNRQSSSYGSGVFKSIDAGKTWTLVGLGESGHIGRIVIDPKDPNTVYVAAVGDLFKPTKERGLYKTSDGGKTWTNTKFIDDDTGFTDVAMDPSNNRVLIAASYQRRRTSWGFNGGGPGGALWRTTDAAKTWVKIDGGLPASGQWGRSGVAFSRSSPNVVYALIQPSATSSQGGGEGGAAEKGPPDPKRDGLWRSDDRGVTWHIVSNQNGRPMYFSQIRVDPKSSEIVYSVARSIAKSVDGGRTFVQVDMEWAQERMQPNLRPAERPQRNRKRSVDNIPPSHHDTHAMWIDPNNSNHLMIGHDGGLDFSYDAGRTWKFIDDWMPLGQFYQVAVDMRRPYYIYGGAQDEGAWGGPSRIRNDGGITKSDWYEVMSGDAWHVAVDPSDWAIVYVEDSVNAGGHTWRLNLKTGEQTYMRPTGGRDAGIPANVVPPLPANEVLRFNWNSPFIISPHNAQTMYFGGNRLFKSRNRGDAWTATKDLTKAIDRSTLPIMGVAGNTPMVAKNDGVGAYGTILSIAESSIVPGVLWVGTDDGNLQVSRDDGATWANVADKVQKFDANYSVTSVEASHFDAATAYAAFDGHLAGDYRPYLFKTTDYGQTWTAISAGLPSRGHINVIKEDLQNRNLIVVGAETGFYISLDAGAHWTPFMNGLPAAPSHDVLVHSRERDLVLATLGRSFYVIDDITPLEQLTPAVLGQDVHVFQLRNAVLWDDDWTTFHSGGEEVFRGENPPEGTYISYYLKAGGGADAKIQIADLFGNVVRELSGSGDAGINRVEWDLRRTPPKPPATRPTSQGGNPPITLGARVAPGTYSVKVTAAGKIVSTLLRVDVDPNR